MEGLSAFGGGREDYGMRTGRYPITPLPIGVKFSAPDLRDSVLALSDCSAPTSGDGKLADFTHDARSPLPLAEAFRNIKSFAATGPNRCE